MPRDIPVGNGNFLIAFDSDYQIRDVYYPYVGLENHAGLGAVPFRRLGRRPHRLDLRCDVAAVPQVPEGHADHRRDTRQ